jgi:hypothetical protein
MHARKQLSRQVPEHIANIQALTATTNEQGSRSFSIKKGNSYWVTQLLLAQVLDYSTEPKSRKNAALSPLTKANGISRKLRRRKAPLIQFSKRQKETFL